MVSLATYDPLQWGTTTGHVIGPASYYDVIDFVFVDFIADVG